MQSYRKPVINGKMPVQIWKKKSNAILQNWQVLNRKEMTMQDHYAYKVYNDDIEKAAEKIAKIIEEA